LNAEQLRRLRADWLGLRVDLFDYAGTHRSQRGFAVRRACTLDDLATLICAAFGRDDTEHLYLYEIGGRRFSHPALACNDGSSTTDVAIGALALRSKERFFHLYDMGDQWQHSCKVETIPRDVLRALRAHGGDRSAAPALQYAATGRSPRQYPAELRRLSPASQLHPSGLFSVAAEGDSSPPAYPTSTARTVPERCVLTGGFRTVL
jgi:hypothetical protein